MLRKNIITNRDKEGENMSCNRINIVVNRRNSRNNRSSSSRRSSSDRSSDSRRSSSDNRSSSRRSSDFDEIEDDDIENIINNNFVEHIEDFIGRTVTIFTTSGGESGSGFTGVLIRVNNRFATLITQVETAPGSAPGNEANTSNITEANLENKNNDTRVNEKCIITHGVETDIPIDRIAAFSHNVV
jgi:hypothetical protein